VEEEPEVALTLIVICVVVLSVLTVIWIKRTRDRQNLEVHSISPEALQALLTSKQKVLLFDVRLPLDLLANSEIIVGATRIPPKELLENPLLIPKEKDSVVYCTCPGDKTARAVLRRAQAMHFLRIKFLKGGLAAWKAKGYPVERYEKSFLLDTRI
jgi:rhodanese-related sulfurtransferase